MADCDVVVIGAGPAGVSAAWPMVSRGLKVLIVDAGLDSAVSGPGEPISMHALRTGKLSTDRLDLGAYAMMPDRDKSPRTRMLPDHAGTKAYLDNNGISCTAFAAVGALARGGLSTIWGNSVSQFDATDMEGWPISPADLREYYLETSTRIGVSGRTDDDMSTILGIDMEMDPALEPVGVARELLSRYEQGVKAGMYLGAPRNAVISNDRPGRHACRLDKACILGCRVGAAYTAAQELEALSRHENVVTAGGILVGSIEKHEDGWQIRGTDRRSGTPWYCRGRYVVVAAGVLASTRLVLQAKGAYDRRKPLINNPAATLAYYVPGQMGKGLPETGFGMAELSYQLGEGPDAVFGLLYGADSFLAGDLANMPFISRVGARDLLRPLLPAMALSMLYFPGSRSRNSVSLNRSGRLDVEGGVRDGFEDEKKMVFRQVRRSFRSLGALLIPLVSRMVAPGAEVHYAGTLPMGGDTSVDCEVYGMPGLYVVDGSVLPSLPAKSHTFTVMANALRVGTKLAGRLQPGGAGS